MPENKPLPTEVIYAMMADNPGNKMSKRRAFFLALFVTVVFCLYSLRLFQIQLVEGDEYSQIATQNYEVNIGIAAARGEILDRYLRPIAINQTRYAVIFDYNYFPRGKDEVQQKRQNDCILDLTSLLSAADETWNDTLPITKTKPYAFEEDRETDVAALKARLNLADYATADNCMKALVEEYGLKGYDEEQQRTIAGVLYEISRRNFSAKNAFVFSDSVSRDTMYKIMENSDLYPGVEVQPTPVREYVKGEVGAHLIGTVGPIYEGEYEELQKKGYALNDTIGRSGIEAAMEDELRGITGTRTLVKDSTGTIIEETETKSPVPGNSVVLTLDTELQAVAQQALDEKIKELRALPATSGGEFNNNGHDVKSGSVVMLDMTGGVLVCASWPSFDLSTYQQNYSELEANPDKPLFNRALNGAFAFGSTAKPAVALAAITNGIIDPTSTVHCGGRYMYYDYAGYTPRCLGRHGNINVVTALAKSCNVFFYDTGRRLTIDPINEYFRLFGLCEKTGIEIGESAGFMDSPEYREENGKIWSAGDTLQAAIGQTCNVTPIQLATYAMTLANDGVRYKTHLVQSVRSYDGQTVSSVEPEVVSRAELTQEAIDTVRQGMIEVVKSGTARNYFQGRSYTLAGKTGTAQIANNKSDIGVFIGYAPVEKPEVAIAVVTEQGSSRASSQIAATVLDAYFASKSEGLSPTPPAQLLP